MLRYDNKPFVYNDNKFLGRYIYLVDPQYIKYEPAKGISVIEAVKVAKDLASRFNTEVKMNVNNIELTVPNSKKIKQQDIIKKYRELLRTYEQLRTEQSNQKN